MDLFCPVTHLDVNTRTKWTGKNLGDGFTSTFYVIGGAIVYSRPEGYAHRDCAQASLRLNQKVAQTVSPGKNYVQIEDYAFLKGATLSARRLFLQKMDNDRRLSDIIFCNLSPQMNLAVKIGRRFKTSKLKVHIAENYEQAVKLALSLCDGNLVEKRALPRDIIPVYPYKKKYLDPLDIKFEKDWDINTAEFINRAVLINNHILHSTCRGHLKPQHVHLIDKLRENCLACLPEGGGIEYIVTDCSNMQGGDRRARHRYMKSLRDWHQKFPLKMYIAHNTNVFMKTALKLAGALMPFKVKVVKDFWAAMDIIEIEKSGNNARSRIKCSEKTSVTINKADMNQMLALLGSFSWEDDGPLQKKHINETHPLFYIFQSIKLIKEEMEDLLEERKRKEKALIEGEARYTSLFINNRSTMLIIDPETGEIVDANPAALRFYGWTHEQMVQKSIYEINTLPPEALAREMDNAQKEKRNHSYFDHCLANGEIRNVEVYSGSITIKDRPLLYSIVHDITKRKQAEEKLNESKERFQLFLDASPDLCFLKDRGGKYLMVNKSNADFFGKEKREIIGKTDFDLMPRKIAGHCQKSDSEVMDKNRMLTATEVIENKVFEVLKIPVTKDSDVTGVAGIFRDITEKKNAELEREKLISKLQNALDEIKTLKGIVPICSSCKKIRDDRGYWNLLESYIEAHSAASFSHSLCPDCSDRFYGSEDWYLEMKKNKDES